MRTTVDIDDDVLTAARSLARSQRRSIGTVLSELARRGLNPSSPTTAGPGGFPAFATADGPPITSESVRAALADDL